MYSITVIKFHYIFITTEKKKTINCPVCTQPNLFSYAQRQSNFISSSYYKESIRCAKCGHSYEYQQTKENDPYTNCHYCGFLLEKQLEVLFKDYYADHYAHKLCYTNERQAQELRIIEYHENNRKKIEEEQRLKKKKKDDEKFESKLRGAFWPGLFIGGLSLAMGIWAILLFGILFGLYLIIGNE